VWVSAVRVTVTEKNIWSFISSQPLGTHNAECVSGVRQGGGKGRSSIASQHSFQRPHALARPIRRRLRRRLRLSRATEALLQAGGGLG